MKLLDTIKDIINESPKFNGTVTHDHMNKRTDMSGEAMRWKDKSPTYRQSSTMEDEDLEETTLSTISRKGRANWSPEAMQDLEAFHPDFLPEEMSIEDLENGSFNKGKYYTIQSPSKWIQEELGEDLKYWSYDIKKNNLGQHLDEYVDKDLYKTLKLNKGGEFNEEEDLDEYRFDFYEEDTRDCPKGMYYCSDDKICKPDSQKLKEQNNPTDTRDEEMYRNNTLYGIDNEVSVSKRIFFTFVKQLVDTYPDTWFDEMGPDLTEHPWERRDQVFRVAKLVGVGKIESLLDKAFWAAHDNYNEIKNGTVTNYNELELRAFVDYAVPLESHATIHKWIYYTPNVQAYDENDAVYTIIRDDNNEYDPWEYENTNMYSEDEHDYEGGDIELRDDMNITKRVLYPAQTGNRTSSGLTFGDGGDDVLIDV